MKYLLFILVICIQSNNNLRENPFVLNNNTKQISKGVQMPLLGVGTWQYDDDTAENEVKLALSAGYKAIDTAQLYNNAKGIGKAIKEQNRSELFITTKVAGGLNYEDTLNQLNEQLKDLQVDYVDLTLIHFPFHSDGTPFTPEGRDIQWKALEYALINKKTRAIGVSHFCKKHIDLLLKKAKITPALNQVEYHVGMGSSGCNANDDRDYMLKLGITQMPFSELCGPCCMGKPSTCTANKELITGSFVTDIGKKYNKTGVQVSLKWLIQQNMPIIPKSINKDHLLENMDVFDWKLNEEDMKKLTNATTPAVSGGGDGKTSGDCNFP